MIEEKNNEESSRLTALSLAALGVVYGDIGTSPLYALRECFFGIHGIPQTHDNILGILSLVFWSLILVISVKYLLYVMRADNKGEGGILALMVLLRVPRAQQRRPSARWIVFISLFGAALLYGDGVLTPAISVLSAVEGLTYATHIFEPYVVPVTIFILVMLFFFQRVGTAVVGRIFGPVILVWFTTIGILGLVSIVREPSILAAVSPFYAINFFMDEGVRAFIILSSVFLVVTGGEALYADMGHFGHRPIKLTWFCVVLPALLLNYFGQGALLLGPADGNIHPFFSLGPKWMIYPLVALATMATVIASQAVISGAYSLTGQAIALGYLPRLQIVHTSAEEEGQIYIPFINWALMILTIWLVLEFRSSSGLASAYGIAVSLTMVITTFLAFFVSVRVWRWRKRVAICVSLLFLSLDLAFFGANIVKLHHGGWVPLVLGLVVFTLMTTWYRGRQIVSDRVDELGEPIEHFIERVEHLKLARLPRTAIFMTSDVKMAPPALQLNWKHNQTLHERNILLTIVTASEPHVSADQRASIENLGAGFYRVILNYGFMERPHVPKALAGLGSKGFDLDVTSATFFLGRETIVATKRPGMALWREKLFSVLSRNARKAPMYFEIPSEQVMEVGTQIEL